MRVAFLGLGNMGAGMAARLLAAGHAVAVHNRTPARAARFEELGARIASSARSAAEKADVIIGMTADDESSRALWLGDAGALAGENLPDALAIECSTLSHDWVIELERHVRDRGFRYVDAPVTGLPDAAAAGTLTLLVGAAAADLDAARPIFTSLATRILHFGAVGQGTVYKLMINLMGAVQIASAAEGIVLAEKRWPRLEARGRRHRQRPGGEPAGGAQCAPLRCGRSRRQRELHAGAAPQGHRIRVAPGAQAGRGARLRRGRGRPLSRAL
jgi:3-hydroxyisobutyrate dehydrogenase